MEHDIQAALFQPLELPCGTVLKNRIAKSAMSDSLGDGRGKPTLEQERLYERWAEGGTALAIVGEVQGNSSAAEKPGNLVIHPASNLNAFAKLVQRGSSHDMALWPQLGHAGAMAFAPISDPRGPSAIDVPGLTCRALTRDEILELPAEFARTAELAKQAGFGGVQVHAAHGFLLSQFLSPLFNKRTDEFGGCLNARARLLLDVIDEVRATVGPSFPIAVKLNATDQLEGGLSEAESLDVVKLLDATTVDLIDISGGTYFPGAKSASDSAGGGPYFLNFAVRARELTRIPLMLTGGFKTLLQCIDAVTNHGIDMIGLARALALDPDLPSKWQTDPTHDLQFPRFEQPPEGGVTAWFTMRLTEIGQDKDAPTKLRLDHAIRTYEARDQQWTEIWKQHFGL